MNEIELEDIEITEVGFFPVVRKYAKRLRLTEIINTLVDSEMEVDIGRILLLLIMDTLSFRTPLYRLADHYSSQDLYCLLGAPMNPNDLQDHNLGRALDKLHETGTQRIVTAVSHSAINAFELDTRSLHFDTTSVSVYGDEYSEEALPLITHGYSKDHRPDLKQFMISLLCTDRNIPIMGVVRNGNATDNKLNNETLNQISTYLAKHGIGTGASVYVADSAMVDRNNLELTGDNIKFITRLPARYNECDRAIREATERGEEAWIHIGKLSQDQATNSPAVYYRYQEAAVTLYGAEYRALVVHSSAHDKRRHKKIDRQLTKDRESLEKQCREACSIEFHCREDAQDAAEKLAAARSALHDIKVSIEDVPKYGKGRPPKGKERRPLQIMFRITAEIHENETAVEELRHEAGCFVLLTNLTSDEDRKMFEGDTLLRLYKEQYGIEQNFGFLKDPAFINGIFLKKPERIEVLGMIMILALMIWRLMEREMRRYIDTNDTTLPGWPRRQTTKPTSFMMSTKFHNVKLVKIGMTIRLAKSFNEVQLAFLKALGAKPEDFLPT